MRKRRGTRAPSHLDACEIRAIDDVEPLLVITPVSAEGMRGTEKGVGGAV